MVMTSLHMPRGEDDDVQNDVNTESLRIRTPYGYFVITTDRSAQHGSGRLRIEWTGGVSVSSRAAQDTIIHLSTWMAVYNSPSRLD